MTEVERELDHRVRMDGGSAGGLRAVAIPARSAWQLKRM
jgi:hypothetical protein